MTVTAPPSRPASAPAAPSAANITVGVADAMRALGREDLEQRLRIAAARVERPATIVSVVGEFKQGKSSLVNAILGGNYCPVDDDLATSAVTLVKYAEKPVVQVRRREGGAAVTETVPPEQIRDFVTESGNPANRRGVERVEIGVPSELLQSGVVLVDTPGMGGLGAGHAAATLAFLPYADGLLFVTDASSELTATELEFLGRARELCPTVLVALTKIDIMASWQRIAELDRGHLRRAGLDLPVFPVSSSLRLVGLRLRSQQLEDESGIWPLIEAADAQIVRPAKELAATRAAQEARAAVDQVVPALRSEREILDDPAALSEATASLTAAKERLEHLRGPGARWATVLADRMTDLTSDATYRLREATRTLGRDYEQRAESLKSPADWDDMGRSLAGDVATVVAQIFSTLEKGVEQLRGEIVELLREDSIELRALNRRGERIDVASLWGGVPIRPEGHIVGRAAGGALSSLRGAQSGIILVGMLGGLLPAAAGAVVLAAPVTLGIGVAFAGSQIIQGNKRKLAQRQQQVRISVRQFLDDVQFQVGNELSEAARSFQRQLRDEFTERATELQRTYAETLSRAQQHAGRAEADRTQRAAVIAQSIGRLEALRAALDRVVPAGGGSVA